MSTATPALCLQIENAPNLRDASTSAPENWPIPSDFPISVNTRGRVLSRAGDAWWDLSPWKGKAARVRFDGGRRETIDTDNMIVFQNVALWWLFGPGGVRTASTLELRHAALKPLFSICSNNHISALDLSRFPKVIEEIAQRLPSSLGTTALTLLHDLWRSREEHGITILDDQGLRQFSGLLLQRESIQTAYIPPRIWTYQVTRLRSCIDDYLAHQEKVEACFKFCLEAYVKNAGSESAAFEGLSPNFLPFNPANAETAWTNGREFHGAFHHTAKRFGIDGLLDRWVNTSSQAGIKSLTSLLSLVSKAGFIYSLNFSLMRSDEASFLNVNSWKCERDQHGDDIYFLSSATSKTATDSEALWIVPEGVKSAFDAMLSVSNLRVAAARFHPDAAECGIDLQNPGLASWAFEPWSSARIPSADLRKRPPNIGLVIKSWPKLFDATELKITKEDLDVANRLTFGLNPEKFAIGKLWPLASHQLRRTGAVNMLSSGLVSDESLQYQLKHVSVLMSRYYGQNYYRLTGTLDDKARGIYLKEMYAALARSFEELKSDSFISPHGDKRKEQILSEISERDHDHLIEAGKSGSVAYGPTFVGGCANPGPPCSLGGITNITGCLGYGDKKPCDFSLLDRRKRDSIVTLRDLLEDRAAAEDSSSHRQIALRAQLEAANRAIYFLDASGEEL